jgi:hypothetical protein
MFQAWFAGKQIHARRPASLIDAVYQIIHSIDLTASN